MASKKYIGKACAYCAHAGSSKTADHVVARQFFLEKDRRNLPQVPACETCNSMKSTLENYALTVLPLGSRHCDARAYSAANIERRLKHNDPIRRDLTLDTSGMWEMHSSGILVPIKSVNVDQEKLSALFGLITKGLFMFYWGIPLHQKWFPDVTIISPERENIVFRTLISHMGQNLEAVRGNLGRGTLVYEGVRGLTRKWYSLWQFTVFGKLQFGNARIPDRAFTRLSVVTRPDMSKAPFTDEETGVSIAAAEQLSL
jgi:hypothetical protein